ncbi:MAG: aspartate dehydrogenase [Shimia sp.]|nr:aspartate dehydrogenase [Shimia sp.]
MNIAILGAGAMAGFVVQNCSDRGILLTHQIVRPGKQGANAGILQVSSVADLPKETSLLVECAGHQGLAQHGPEALWRGIDVLTVSIGALADQSLLDRLETAAREGGATLQLASGALGALDVLRAAAIGGLDHVSYRGRKPPAGWRGSPAEKVLDLDKPLAKATTHFSGTAREAALAYPKNANVAAAVALAGAGLDETTVELIADPVAVGNTHEVEASGAFGTMTFQVTGKGLPENPRTSALAAMSVVSAIIDRQRRVRF